MSKEEVIKEISQMLDQKLAPLKSGGSGNEHKTLVEMMDCPNCSKGFIESLKTRLKEQPVEQLVVATPTVHKCEDCGKEANEGDEECVECFGEIT